MKKSLSVLILTAFAAAELCAQTAVKNFADIQDQFVEIPDQNILMLKTEVTQKLYKNVMGTRPSEFFGKNNPVENISWYDAVYFCNKMSLIYGLTPVYTVDGEEDVDWWQYTPEAGETIDGVVEQNPDADGFRLPSRKEWNFAAKGGETYTYAGSNKLDEVAWYKENCGGKTHPAAQKKANGYGLYDMNGNVWEWCWDPYGDDKHYCCGCSWDNAKASYKFSSKGCGETAARRSYIGFRIVVAKPIEPDVTEEEVAAYDVSDKTEFKEEKPAEIKTEPEVVPETSVEEKTPEVDEVIPEPEPAEEIIPPVEETTPAAEEVPAEEPAHDEEPPALVQKKQHSASEFSNCTVQVVVQNIVNLEEADITWLPGLVQDSVKSNFQEYLGMRTIVDQDAETAVKKLQAQSESMARDEETAIELGKITTAQFAAFIKIRKTAGGYSISVDFTDLTTGEEIASATSKDYQKIEHLYTTISADETTVNCSAVDEVTVELAKKLGIDIGDLAKKVLTSGISNLTTDQQIELAAQNAEQYQKLLEQYDKAIEALQASNQKAAEETRRMYEAERNELLQRQEEERQKVLQLQNPQPVVPSVSETHKVEVVEPEPEEKEEESDEEEKPLIDYSQMTVEIHNGLKEDEEEKIRDKPVSELYYGFGGSGFLYEQDNQIIGPKCAMNFYIPDTDLYLGISFNYYFSIDTNAVYQTYSCPMADLNLGFSHVFFFSKSEILGLGLYADGGFGYTADDHGPYMKAEAGLRLFITPNFNFYVESDYDYFLNEEEYILGLNAGIGFRICTE